MPSGKWYACFSCIVEAQSKDKPFRDVGIDVGLSSACAPNGWVGSATVQFTKGGWTVKVSNAVVLEPVYTVEVEYAGSNAFCWKGTVNQAGNVLVNEFSQ